MLDPNVQEFMLAFFLFLLPVTLIAIAGLIQIIYTSRPDLFNWIIEKYIQMTNLYHRIGRPMEATLDHKVLVIPYVYKGTNYVVRLPIVRNGRQVVVTGVKEDESTIDLTQQQGISYQITANDLGFKEIIVDNGFDQKSIHGTQLITF